MNQISHNRREYLDFYAEAGYRRYAEHCPFISPGLIHSNPVHKSRLKNVDLTRQRIWKNVCLNIWKSPCPCEYLIRSKRQCRRKIWGLRRVLKPGTGISVKTAAGEEKVLPLMISILRKQQKPACQSLKKAGAEQVLSPCGSPSALGR